MGSTGLSDIKARDLTHPSTRNNQCLAQNLTVTNMIGENKNKLAVHPLGVFGGKITLAVDEFLIKTIGVRNIRIEVEFHEGKSSMGRRAGKRV